MSSLKTPAGDWRTYRYLELKNGARILLVKDATLKQTSAAFSFRCGSLQDPKDLPGLAHFVEHMLFMGTKSYRIAEDIRECVKPDGHTSAETLGDKTTFHFRTSGEFLQFKLVFTRMAEFFIDPLLSYDPNALSGKSSYTPDMSIAQWEAAIQIDAEMEKYSELFMRRFDQLRRNYSIPGHAYNNFAIGSRKTLWDNLLVRNINPVQRAKAFFEANYSSTGLTVCVLGDLDLERTAEEIVPIVDKIRRATIKAPTYTVPYGPSEMGYRVEVVPNSTLRALVLDFATKDLTADYKNDCPGLVCYMVNMVGPGSLDYGLKKRGWISEVVAVPNATAVGFGFLTIMIGLLEDGLDHIDEIVGHFFTYVKWVVRKSIGQAFDGYKALKRFEFQQQKERNGTLNEQAIALALNMHKYAADDVLIGPYAAQNTAILNTQAVDAFLAEMDPSHMVMYVVSNSFKSPTNSIDPWHATEHRRSKINPDLLKTWQTIEESTEYYLPTICDFFTDVGSSTANEKPDSQVLCDDDQTMGRFWRKEINGEKDSVIIISFNNESFESDELNAALSKVYVKMLAFSLTGVFDAARIVGQSIDIQRKPAGFDFILVGSPGVQAAICKKVFEKIRNFKLDLVLFETIRREVDKELAASENDRDPYRRSMELLECLLNVNRTPLPKQRFSLAEFIVGSLEWQVEQFFSKYSIEILLYGNVNAEMMNMVKVAMKSVMADRPMTPDDVSFSVENPKMIESSRGIPVILRDGTSFVLEELEPRQRSTLVTAYFQAPGSDPHYDMCCLMMATMIQNRMGELEKRCPLKTATAQWFRARGTSGIAIHVESLNGYPRVIDAEIEIFLKNILEELLQMPEKRFIDYKALIVRPIAGNLREKAFAIWNEIENGSTFYIREVDEKVNLEHLALDWIRAFFTNLIAAGTRRKVCVSVISPALKQYWELYAQGDDYRATTKELKKLVGPLPEAIEITKLDALKPK